MVFGIKKNFIIKNKGHRSSQTIVLKVTSEAQLTIKKKKIKKKEKTNEVT